MIKGQTLWQVDLGTMLKDGKPYRQRRTFTDKHEAQTFAELKKIERTNYGSTGIALSERLRAEALEADRILAPHGLTILDCARYTLRHHEAIARSETLERALQAFLRTKSGDNLRSRYLADLRVRVGRFARTFGERKVADITAAEIDQYLREVVDGAPLHRNTVRQRLSVFFKFCKGRGWVQSNPITDVPQAKVTAGTPGILTPEQIARLLETASEETLPFFALGAFAGLRSAEIERLEWRHIRFEEGLVEVPALSSKTAARRFINIQPNLAAWLAPYRDRHGKVCPGDLSRRLLADRRRAGITEWPANALRHSFASYYLAHFKNAAELALEMGHTNASVTFRHYRELVRPSEAERFWRIVPAVHAESIAFVA